MKVMQALFAFQGSEGTDVAAGEKLLTHSIDKVYELYILQLLFLVELLDAARERIEEGRKKRLPTPDDLNPNLRLVNNTVLLALEASTALRKEQEQRRLYWRDHRELVRKLFSALRESEEYQAYMAGPETDTKSDRAIVHLFYERFMLNDEHLLSIYEERSIHSANDAEQVAQMVERTIQSVKSAELGSRLPLLPLYKDTKEDTAFVRDLFRKTLQRHDENLKLIKARTANWETERLASTDLLLMEMALTEFITLTEVPPKVSMNEYIEIAKEYSTPKSANFINGILDSLLIDLRAKGLVRKEGKGLVE